MTWLKGYRMAVALCFDVDAEAGWVTDPTNRRRLSLLSAAAFGRRVGVGRILELLAKHQLRATFFIPGYTAEIDPDVVRRIAAAGHAVGCHGYHHERTDTLTWEEEDDILRRSKAVLAALTGAQPIGYRAPWWELTPQTLVLLDRHGFLYDSSLMGLDRPYLVRVPETDRTLFEIPVTWLLDDWEQFAYSAVPASGCVIEEPDKVFRLWKAEFDALCAAGGVFTLTMHPEVIGRASRIRMLDDLIQAMKQHPGVWFCTLDELYAAWSSGEVEAPVFDY
ncbi:polysaccharide deacetylase [Alicyclobacillus cellulosilyticus]|uniref:Polysaccharide deacetylase n=1 Tax=Alicyclobacillus cellulosilyticus TaxID=1003997 RepID=A0A917K4V7_9BACL|nr:polysaccharide deacetylase [Alicyclobacillus cellulosilyticus]GGJ00129.1 polysaccharide deacetylase [Alicyclobacillus cellulosilyticus]